MAKRKHKGWREGNGSGAVYEDGGFWWVRYMETVLVGGKPFRRRVAHKLGRVGDAIPNERAARSEAQEFMGDVAKRANQQKFETTGTLANYLNRYTATGNDWKPATFANAAMHHKLLEPHIPDLQMRRVQSHHIEEIVAAVAVANPHLSRNTLRNCKSLLSGCFNHAIAKGHLTCDNPCVKRRVKIPRALGTVNEPKNPYSPREIQQMLNVLPEPARTVVLIAAFTGLRKNEIAGLKWSDVKERELHVARTLYRGLANAPKTEGSAAPLPLLPQVREALDQHRKRTFGGSEWVFTSATGGPVNLQSLVTYVIAPALEKVGIEWRGWHCFRHHFATALHHLGLPARTIQALMRHSNFSTTAKYYLHVVPEESHRALEQFTQYFEKSAKQLRVVR